MDAIFWPALLAICGGIFWLGNEREAQFREFRSFIIPVVRYGLAFTVGIVCGLAAEHFGKGDPFIRDLAFKSLYLLLAINSTAALVAVLNPNLRD